MEQSAKTHPSTQETDRYAYGDCDDPESGCHHTGWYVYMSLDRRNRIRDFLGLPRVYCVGVRNDDGRIFIQLGGRDPRNGSVTYVEVDEAYREAVMKLILEPVSDEEFAKMQKEDRERMDAAARGVYGET